jgi:hypothetical protein
MAPNFAVRWFEIDPAYLVIRTLAAIGVVQFASNDREPETQEGVYPASAAQTR